MRASICAPYVARYKTRDYGLETRFGERGRRPESDPRSATPRREAALEEQRLADRGLDRVDLVGLANKKGGSGSSPIYGRC